MIFDINDPRQYDRTDYANEGNWDPYSSLTDPDILEQVREILGRFDDSVQQDRMGARQGFRYTVPQTLGWSERPGIMAGLPEPRSGNLRSGEQIYQPPSFEGRAADLYGNDFGGAWEYAMNRNLPAISARQAIMQLFGRDPLSTQRGKEVALRKFDPAAYWDRENKLAEERNQNRLKWVHEGGAEGVRPVIAPADAKKLADFLKAQTGYEPALLGEDIRSQLLAGGAKPVDIENLLGQVVNKGPSSLPPDLLQSMIQNLYSRGQAEEARIKQESLRQQAEQALTVAEKERRAVQKEEDAAARRRRAEDREQRTLDNELRKQEDERRRQTRIPINQYRDVIGPIIQRAGIQDPIQRMRIELAINNGRWELVPENIRQMLGIVGR